MQIHENTPSVSAEKPTFPMLFNGNYDFAPSVVFVAKFMCLVIIYVNVIGL